MPFVTLTDGGADTFLGVHVSLQSDYTIPSSSQTTIPYGSGTTQYDVGDWHDESTNNERLVVPSAADGKYVVAMVNVIWTSVPFTGPTWLAIRHFDSGGVQRHQIRSQSIDDNNADCVLTPAILCSAGDYFTSVVWQESGTNKDIWGKSTNSQFSNFSAWVVG
jgi:hypothetical protein